MLAMTPLNDVVVRWTSRRAHDAGYAASWGGLPGSTGAYPAWWTGYDKWKARRRMVVQQ